MLELPGMNMFFYSPAQEQSFSAKDANWNPGQTKWLHRGARTFASVLEHRNYYQSQLIIKLLRKSLTSELSLILDANTG